MGGYADSPVDPIQLLEAIIESIPKCNDENGFALPLSASQLHQGLVLKGVL